MVAFIESITMTMLIRNCLLVSYVKIFIWIVFLRWNLLKVFCVDFSFLLTQELRYNKVTTNLEKWKLIKQWYLK